MMIYPCPFFLFGIVLVDSVCAFISVRPNNLKAPSKSFRYDSRHFLSRPLVDVQRPISLSIYMTTDGPDYTDIVGVEKVEELKNNATLLRSEAEEASKKALATETEIENIQQKIKSAEKELLDKDKVLLKKDDLLKAAEKTWLEQKNAMTDRLAELTKMVKKKDDESVQVQTSLKKAASKREDELENVISDLKETLQNAQNVLEEEKQRVDELRSRLNKTEDSLEFEQDLFEKEKRELDARIGDEKSKNRILERKRKGLETKIQEDETALADMQEQLKMEKQKFAKDKRVLENEINNVIKVRKLKAEQMNERYSQIRKEMTSLWVNAKADARKEESKLRKVISQRTQDIANLEEVLSKARSLAYETEKAKENVERQNEEAAQKMQEMSEEFCFTLLERDESIAGLEKNISDYERDKVMTFEEISMLKDNLFEEKRNRKQDENDFESKKLKFENEMSQLKDENEGKEQTLRRRMGQMQINYDSMKLEMTAQMVKVKSDVIKEENIVKENYENKLSVLRSDVSQRDEQIIEYESSFRNLAKLSLKLTGKRIRKSTSRVKNIFSKKNKQLEE